MFIILTILGACASYSMKINVDSAILVCAYQNSQMEHVNWSRLSVNRILFRILYTSCRIPLKVFKKERTRSEKDEHDRMSVSYSKEQTVDTTYLLSSLRDANSCMGNLFVISRRGI